MTAVPRAAVVVAAWGVANLALAGLLVTFDSNPFEYVLYFASVLPISVAAAALWLAGPERGNQDRVVLPGATAPVVGLTVAITLIGLGVIFANWLSIVGALVAVAMVIALIRWRS